MIKDNYIYTNCYPRLNKLGNKIDFEKPLLNKLNNIHSNYEILYLKFKYEIKLILSQLKFEYNFKDVHYLILQCYNYYNQLDNRFYKNTKYIVVIIIFIEYSLKYYFINIKDYLNIINISKPNFYKILRNFFNYNKSVFIKLKSKRFRLKFINNTIIGFANSHNINQDFIKNCINLNSKLFDLLNKKPNAVIIGIILYLIKKKYNLKDSFFIISDITNYLGIYPSTINLKVVNKTLKNKKIVIKNE